MDLEKELNVAVRAFCKMKLSVCKIEEGPHDLMPMLHFKYSHLNAYCGMVLDGGNPLEMLTHSWRKILDDGIPEFVMFMVEGYASTKNVPEEIRNHRHGSLEKDFKENPDSEVVEVITIQAVEIKTGKQMTAVVSFKYGDDGMPEFSQPCLSVCEGAALECNVPKLVKSCRDATLNFFEKVA